MIEHIECPKGEQIWVSYFDTEKKLRFIVTSKENNRDYYFLYEFAGARLSKIGKARSPKELEEKFKVRLSEGLQ